MTDQGKIKKYLKEFEVNTLVFKNVMFDTDIAKLNEKDLFYISQEDQGVIIISDLDGEAFCYIEIKEMNDLFPNFIELSVCQSCEGKGWYDNDPHDMTRIECECEDVIYK